MLRFLNLWNKRGYQLLTGAAAKEAQDAFDLYIDSQLLKKPVAFQDIFHRIQANDKTLTDVTLASLTLDDSDIVALSYALRSNDHVTALDLSGNRLGKRSTHSLAILPNLRSLNISSNPSIDDEALQPFQGNRSIRELNASYCGIGDAGVNSLVQTQISRLRLAGNRVGNAGVAVLAADLTLVALDISANDFDDTAVTPFKAHPNMEELVLEHGQLSDATAEIFIGMSKLHFLNLRANNYTSKGAKTLARSKTLEAVDLSSNDVGKGAEAFVDNTVLIYLNLETNKIEPRTAEAFERNATLQKLLLDGNNLNKDLIARINAHRSSSPTAPKAQ
ncbi:MAG: hypothetical protein NXI01_08755 [Gammaproteobacteria bacterium]|nr:hypothetical protein [Gammaproteobacteria bacterium]